MRQSTKKNFEQMIRNGIWEATTDINQFGRVEIRVIRNGKRETITITNP